MDEFDWYDDYDQPIVEVCDCCNGDGYDPGNDYALPCPKCDGEGKWRI